MVEVRPYKREDHPALVANLQEADMFNPLCEAEDNYRSLTDEHPESVLVAQVDGEVAGSVLISSFGVNIALVWRLVVAEKYRRKGVATKLLMEAEQSIGKRGFQETWAFASSEDEDLIDFYKKNGWNWFREPKTYASLWK